jgi:hypothetical protein
MTTALAMRASDTVELKSGRDVDLRSFSKPSPGRLVIEARDTVGDLVGTAILTTVPSGSTGELTVSVRPWRKNDGLGRALVDRAIVEAGALGLSYLTASYPSCDRATRRMLDASPAIVSRRVWRDTTKVAILVPRPAP